MEKETIGMGHIQKLHIDLKGVMENMNLDSQKSINLYVGANGTGKTLVLIFQWLLGTMGTIYLSSGKSMQEYEKILQFFFDKSFDQNDFTGKMGGVFKNLEISFEINSGKVSNLDIIIPDPSIQVIPEGMPVFMSKSTRLFTEIVKYHRLKKSLGINQDITLSSDKDLDKLCEFWKLYDILFMERMKARITSPTFVINEKAKQSFVETMGKDIRTVSYDAEKCDFVVHELKDGVLKQYSACILSAGEQAWLNMFIQM